MSLRRRRFAATLVAALALAGAALVSTLGTSTFLAGCPDPKNCGDPNFARSHVVAAPVSVRDVSIQPCPDPNNCIPPQ
jgi:hypothetical protein